MTILNPEISVQPEPTNAPVQITDPAYRGVTVDTRYTPADSLMAFMTGSAWTVSYYSQVLGADSPLGGFNPNQAPSSKQYRLIRNFVLKATTALTPSQNDLNQQQMTGTSNVFPVLRPNVGDVFLADMGDGREGMFEVTDVHRLSIMVHPAHEIEYKWLQEANQTYYEALAASTIDTLVFVYDFLQTGQNPLVHQELYEDIAKLSVQFGQIADHYVRSFLSKEYMTLLVPEQMDTMYDPYLTKAVLNYLTTFDATDLRYVRKLNCDGDDVVKSNTLWDLLQERNPLMMRRCGKRVGYVRAREFTSVPMFEGVYHSGVRNVVYLKDPDLSIDAKRAGVQLPLAGNLNPSEDPTSDTSTTPLLPQVCATDYYILSQAFYERTTGMSKLEAQVWNYLEEKELDVAVVVEAAKQYLVLSDLERFYLGPIFLVLMKAVMRST